MSQKHVISDEKGHVCVDLHGTEPTANERTI